jgi:hypothetical protein
MFWFSTQGLRRRASQRHARSIAAVMRAVSVAGISPRSARSASLTANVVNAVGQ